ncbi:MAG: adenine deaminase [Chloroflexi bacterium]|nr:adenine deaminase [Chloroflexota bacterium]
MAVAQGDRPAELVVRNTRVFNVFTGEFLPGHDVAVAEGRVAFVGPNASHTIGDETQELDADGQTMLPGLVEGHTHLFSQPYGIDEFIRYAAPGGTTTVVTEVDLIGLLGVDGATAALDGFAGQPIRLLATVPPLCGWPSYPEHPGLDLTAFRALLQRPEVVGLGEMYWGNLLRDEGQLQALVSAALEAGKRAEGHTAGARGPKLQAYACSGATSCHEPIDAEQALERLRLGFYFMARQGQIRRDLPMFAPLWKDHRVDLRRMILVTDSVSPRYLLTEGSLEANVQQAIDLGLEPARAVQAVTLNPAEHFGLEQEVGSVAPGRSADLLLVPDERTIRPSLVLCRGQVIARDGRMLVEPRRLDFPARFYTTIKRPRIIRPRDLAVVAEGGASRRVRVIDLVTDLVSRETSIQVGVVEGEIQAQPANGLLKVVAVDRARRTNDLFVGFIKGYGLQRGAVATSMSWDASCMVAVGADDRDIALALCRLLDSHGGVAVCEGGRLLAEIVTPLAGLTGVGPLPMIADDLDAVDDAVRRLGCKQARPTLAVNVLTTPAIPFFRISDRGYLRVKSGEYVGLFSDDTPLDTPGGVGG